MFSFVLRMCQCILTSASGCQQRVCWGLCTDGWAGDFSKPNPSVLPGLPVLQTTWIAILYLQHRHTISFWGKVLGKSLNKGKISYVCWAQLVPAACVGNHRCLLDLHTGTQQTCTQKKKLLNELKKIRVNFSTKFNYIFPPKSNLFEMSCCNLVV